MASVKKITSIEDLRLIARSRVPRMFYDYADSGSWSESTYRDNTNDFEQRIKNEIEENPALETGTEEKATDIERLEDANFSENNFDNQEIDIESYIGDDETPSYKLNAFNYNSEVEEKSAPISSHTSLHENLKNQTNVLILTEKEKIISDFIIGSIDESGYLSRSIDELIDDIAFTQNQIVSSKLLLNKIFEIAKLKKNIKFNKKNKNEYHYSLSPYEYFNEEVNKIVPDRYIDLDSGIMSLIKEINKNKN